MTGPGTPGLVPPAPRAPVDPDGAVLGQVPGRAPEIITHVPDFPPTPVPISGGDGPSAAAGPPDVRGRTGARAAACVRIGLSDGRRLTIRGHALLGRAPVPAPGEEVAQLVTVRDPTRSVSSTHVALAVDDSGAWIVDRGSTNGTVVTLPDGQQILCVPWQRVRVPDGARVRFGDASFLVATDVDGIGGG
ncbi:MAG: FHA domain-containing protein [Cellulomonas sp.]